MAPDIEPHEPATEVVDDDEELVLPWYYSWWRVAVLASALTVGAVGLLALATTGRPGPNSIDVRFLQDMRSHHDQAVLMSISYLRKDGTDPLIETIAAEVLLSQQQETGIMVEILRSFGVPEENSTGTAMEWMNQPITVERMPGMASEDELDRLEAATGPDADRLFAALMVAHHEGGILMAQYAAERAESGRVEDAANAMAAVQTEEADELRSILERLGSES